MKRAPVYLLILLSVFLTGDYVRATTSDWTKVATANGGFEMGRFYRTQGGLVYTIRFAQPMVYVRLAHNCSTGFHVLKDFATTDVEAETQAKTIYSLRWRKHWSGDEPSALPILRKRCTEPVSLERFSTWLVYAQTRDEVLLVDLASLVQKGPTRSVWAMSAESVRGEEMEVGGMRGSMTFFRTDPPKMLFRYAVDCESKTLQLLEVRMRNPDGQSERQVAGSDKQMSPAPSSPNHFLIDTVCAMG